MEKISLKLLLLYLLLDTFDDDIPSLEVYRAESLPFYEILGDINNIHHFYFNNKAYFSENREAINKFFTADLISAEIDKMYDFLNNIDKFQNNPRPKKIDDASLLLMEI